MKLSLPALWCVALLASIGCLPNDPSTKCCDDSDDEEVVVIEEDDRPEPDREPEAEEEPPPEEELEPDPEEEPDPDEEPDPQEDPEPQTLPEIPYAYDELPADAEAPWPGEMVNGALVRVSHVVDGDTVNVETDWGSPRVRVLGINAPECDKEFVGNYMACDPDEQDLSGDAEVFGVEAYQGLRDLVLDREVRIACDDSSGECEADRYDRYLAFLVVDGIDASEYMAANGLAWTYTSFATDNVLTYCVAEDDARTEGVGMWEAGRDSVIQGMNNSTRRWYGARDAICQAHAQ